MGSFHRFNDIPEVLYIFIYTRILYGIGIDIIYRGTGIILYSL